MAVNKFPVSSHFLLSEFESPDTQEVKLHPSLVERLEALRELVGLPVVILSGYRTAEHNHKVGGTQDSFHRRGMAADVTWAGINVDRGVELAREAGFRGIGRNRSGRSLHVDLRPHETFWDE